MTWGPTSGTSAGSALEDPAPADPPDSHEPVLPGDRRAAPRPRPRERWPYWLAVLVLVIGLAVTGVLVWVSRMQYDHNEKRILDLRVRELGALLATSLPTLQTPLASAAALADATNGNVEKFRHLVAPYVGPRPTHQFVTISLWRLDQPQKGPVAVVGLRPVLASNPDAARAYFGRTSRSSKLTVIGLTPPRLTRLGYGFATPGASTRYAAYGESEVPPNRRSRYERNAAFSDLDYAIYLGAPTPQHLLVTSLSHPIHGRQARLTLPFGDMALTVVVTPRVPVSGTLPERLPWIIAIVGLLLAMGVGALTVRLTQRHRAAEHMAGRLEQAVGENRRLYAEQRTIAQTLQHALLPEQLPAIDGAQASACYAPGERGVEIGGDWYDVIGLADGRLLVVVGDVSGHGLRAASTMASLRYAIHAYAAQGDPPESILSKLSTILDVTTAKQLATVLLALVDVEGHEISVASAGHLPPLLISDHRGQFIESDVGPPIGVPGDSRYTSRTIAVPPNATFLAFTDGLVERRGESLDEGLERLRSTALAHEAPLQELVQVLVQKLRQGLSEDDTAIVGVRWKS